MDRQYLTSYLITFATNGRTALGWTKTNGSKIKNGSRPLGQTVFDECHSILTFVGGYEAEGSVGYEEDPVGTRQYYSFSDSSSTFFFDLKK